MTGTLVILRHGESTWNQENLFTGWHDVPLSAKGEVEAAEAGRVMAEAGLWFDLGHTSLLTRAVDTAHRALGTLGQPWLPLERSWRLNERHYGALQGLDKKATAARYGAEQTHLWRRSYDVPPPPASEDSGEHPRHDRRYERLAPDQLPATECLKDVVARVLPYWHDRVVPQLRADLNVLVVAHGNSLRALVKHLEGIADETIADLNIPTGVPRRYTFDPSLSVTSVTWGTRMRSPQRPPQLPHRVWPTNHCLGCFGSRCAVGHPHNPCYPPPNDSIDPCPSPLDGLYLGDTLRKGHGAWRSEGTMSLAENLAAVRTVERGKGKGSTRPVPVLESKNRLKAMLMVGDGIALLAAWTITVAGWSSAYRPWWVTALLPWAMAAVGVWIQHAHSLYLARICNIRLVELSRVMRSAILIGLAALAASRVLKVTLVGPEVVVGTILTLLFLIVARSTYRAWLATARRSGRYTRDVVLVGTNTEAARLMSLLSDHPDTGLRVVGVVGDRIAAVANGLGALWCGTADTAGDVLVGKGANGVIIAAGALATDELNECIRDLQSRQAHVHLSSGVQGVDYRRLLPAPLAHEPLLYLESTDLSRWQLAIKRAQDIAVSGFLLLVASPVLLVTSLAIKLGDRGPVMFKQTRVGKDGRLFKVWKFRSMVVDAEARLKALEAANERTGPLFKMDRDPRVTRIGHFLRSSSIDELPQLFNVLRGEMSLVGPRPALPSEVARFDDALLNRSKVKPGITGLWQVEARDNPAFSAYRRLDLFYVENWSVTLDLIILLATAEQVVARLVHILKRHRTEDAAAEAPAAA